MEEDGQYAYYEFEDLAGVQAVEGSDALWGERVTRSRDMVPNVQQLEARPSEHAPPRLRSRTELPWLRGPGGIRSTRHGGVRAVTRNGMPTGLDASGGKADQKEG